MSNPEAYNLPPEAMEPMPLPKKEEEMENGSCNEVFAFEPREGEVFVCKIAKEDSWVFKDPNKSLQEKVNILNRRYFIMRQYIGEYMADSYFTVGKRSNGSLCILTIQEKIEGTRLDKITGVIDKDSASGILAKLPPEIRSEWIKLLNLAINEMPQTDEFKNGNLPGCGDFAIPSNIIVTKDNQIKIVDW